LLLQVIGDLFKPDKKDGELELYLGQAELLAKEADILQCNVTRDLEKLKASHTTPLPITISYPSHDEHTQIKLVRLCLPLCCPRVVVLQCPKCC